jgi:hypothetical protein
MLIVEAARAEVGERAVAHDHVREAQAFEARSIGDAAADAYRALRSAQHRARLDEQATHFEAAAYAGPREAILAAWHHVFAPPVSASAAP